MKPDSYRMHVASWAGLTSVAPASHAMTDGDSIIYPGGGGGGGGGESGD